MTGSGGSNSAGVAVATATAESALSSSEATTASAATATASSPPRPLPLGHARGRTASSSSCFAFLNADNSNTDDNNNNNVVINEDIVEETSGILSKVLKDNRVYLGGSSIGKGLAKAARYHLGEKLLQGKGNEALVAAADLHFGIPPRPHPVQEESFFVVDLGIVVSQVYQWRKFFPRVEPFYGAFIR